ncbi:MAG TPA: hypothetical protein VF275_03005 [Gammaproteobacteria bacterium]
MMELAAAMAVETWVMIRNRAFGVNPAGISSIGDNPSISDRGECADLQHPRSRFLAPSGCFSQADFPYLRCWSKARSVLPSDGAWPPALRLNDNPVPEGWLAQLWYPAVRYHSEPAPDQAGYR